MVGDPGQATSTKRYRGELERSQKKDTKVDCRNFFTSYRFFRFSWQKGKEYRQDLASNLPFLGLKFANVVLSSIFFRLNASITIHVFQSIKEHVFAFSFQIRAWAAA